MIYTIEYDKQPQKFLEKSENHINKRIMNKIAKKSRLTQKDVNEIAHKINKETFLSLDKR